MNRRMRWVAVLAMLGLAAAGCQEDAATGSDDAGVAGGDGAGGADGVAGADGGAGGDGGADGGLGGGDGGGGVDGGLPPDAGPVGPNCDGVPIRDFFDLAADNGDGSYTLTAETSDQNVMQGSCDVGNDAGNDAFFDFTTPEAGFWLFVVDEADAGFDTILYAPTLCGDPGSELGCNDDIDYPDDRRSGLRLRLAAGDEFLLVVDAFAGDVSGGSFVITARQIPEVAVGAECDRLQLANGCVDSAFCRVDLAADGEAPPATGVCTENTPPVVDEALAYNQGDHIGLLVRGSDPSRDATRVLVQLLAGEEVITLDADGNDMLAFTVPDVIYGLEQFEFTARPDWPQAFPQTTGLLVAVEDSQGNRSEAARADLVAAPVIELGADCDGKRLVDVCVEGSACLDPEEDESFVCVEVHPPALMTFEVFINPESRAMGLYAVGMDPDNDVVGLNLWLLDAEGAVIDVGAGDDAIPFEFVDLDQADGNFEGHLDLFLPEDLDFGAARVSVYDSEGLVSETVDAEPAGPAAAARGDVCDAVAARVTCPETDVCWSDEEDADLLCTEPVVECPADWTVIDLNAQGDAPEWRYEGDTTDAAYQDGGSCGGGVGADVFSFQAPVAGRYTFLTASDAEGADTLAYVRTHCRFPVAQLELACNDDIAQGNTMSLLDVQLEADQVVYVFVDGFTDENGGWQGPYTLVARQQ